MMQFQKAVKSKAKLRLALFGASGSGKTFTSLRIASGMGGNIALIDTERGSASKYADRFQFDVLDLDTPTTDRFCEAIQAAAQAGYSVLILDSMTHAWKQLLDEVERIAKAKYKGNTWSAWSEGTPKQNKLIDTLLHFPGHIIATMRTKTEWTTETDTRSGKSRPVRVGLAPEQGKGIEYEFDLLMELSVDHTANVIKDRTGKYQDAIIEKPGEDFGKELVAWLNDGAAMPERKPASERPNGNDARLEALYGPEVEKAAVTKVERPYPAIIMPDKFSKMVDACKKSKTVPTDQQRNMIAANLELCFAGTGEETSKRKSVMRYLCGASSVKDLSSAEACAFIKWLSAAPDENGDWMPDANAVTEANNCLTGALKEEGQQELPL